MRWAWETDGSRLAVHDHTGRTVVDEADYGSMTWSGIPGPVRRAILDAARQAVAAGDMQYALAALACLAADEVVEGGPEATEDVDVASSDGDLSVDVSASLDLSGRL
jgi:hypothetical protein